MGRARWILAPAVAASLALLAPSIGHAQFVDQHFTPIHTVPEPGLYAPEVQAAIEEGFALLAAASGPTDDENLDAAKEAFQRALSGDPDAAHAINGLGVYELTKDEAWLVLLESFKKLFNRDHISMAVRRFEEALDADPEMHAARYNLALAHRQSRGKENYERAARILEELIERAPDFADTAMLLVYTYRDAGDVDSMSDAIDRIEALGGFPPAGVYLLRAYAWINSERVDEGVEEYWKGVDAIASERDADLFWHDVEPIVSARADTRFKGLDVAQRKAYLREFWQGLADESFVTADERLVEHYRRLRIANQNYRLTLPERRHYSSGAAYVPERQSGYDDRGVIFLRHGEPDDTATYSGPDVEQNISWKYNREGGEPLVFHFVSDEDVDDYKLVRRLGDAIITNSTKLSGQQTFNRTCGLPGGICDSYDARILAGDLHAFRDLYSSRGHIDPFYDRVATGLDAQTLEREEENLARDIALGTSTQSFSPEPPESPLPYPIHPVAFRSPSGSTEVSFYYALPTTEISVLPSPTGGSEVDYRYQLLVRSSTGEGRVRQEDDVAVATSNPIPRDAGVMLPAVRTLEVPPGEYSYGMKVTDLNSGRFGVQEGAVTAYDFSSSGLSLSGIVLADRVEPASGRSPFVRWGRLKVLPLPSRIFRRSQPVFVYYEVYGLTPDEGGARFRTTYKLESAVPDRNVVARFFSAVGELLTRDDERGGVTYSFERSEAASIDPLLDYFSLDVSESPPGDYVLTVEVEDVATGTHVERVVNLSLVE